MIPRAITQLVGEFLATAGNRLGMQAGDFRDLLQATMPTTPRLTRRNPPALLFVQPAEQHIQLPMILTIDMIACQTRRTTTLVSRTFRDHLQPLLG